MNEITKGKAKEVENTDRNEKSRQDRKKEKETGKRK